MKRSLLLAGVLLLTCAWVARGDNPPAEGAKATKSARQEKLPMATPEREAAALMFVQINHPELSAVLEQLKADKPGEYDKAIRELFKTCEQLNRTQDSDPRKYALDLDAWKIKSRIQLLAARASLSADPALDTQLKDATNRQSEIRIAQLALQREQMAQKLAKLDEQLAQAEQDRQPQADKQYNTLMRGISKARASAAKKQKKSSSKQDDSQPRDSKK